MATSLAKPCKVSSIAPFWPYNGWAVSAGDSITPLSSINRKLYYVAASVAELRHEIEA